MNPKVVVVDSGMGNVFSICNALQHCGAEVTLSASAADILSAQRIVLPGVGSFREGMKALKGPGLDEMILEFSHKERPILGICLGMQVLLEIGEEFGEWPGLNLIPGRVVKIPDRDSEGSKHKIPQIGWNQIYPPSQAKDRWEKSILSHTAPQSMVYFVHSYHAVPANTDHILALCNYHGLEITAAVKKDNIFGCQFHPEKSGKTGLGTFKKFMGV